MRDIARKVYQILLFPVALLAFVVSSLLALGELMPKGQIYDPTHLPPGQLKPLPPDGAPGSPATPSGPPLGIPFELYPYIFVFFLFPFLVYRVLKEFFTREFTTWEVLQEVGKCSLVSSFVFHALFLIGWSLVGTTTGPGPTLGETMLWSFLGMTFLFVFVAGIEQMVIARKDGRFGKPGLICFAIPLLITGAAVFIMSR